MLVSGDYDTMIGTISRLPSVQQLADRERVREVSEGFSVIEVASPGGIGSNHSHITSFDFIRKVHTF